MNDSRQEKCIFFLLIAAAVVRIFPWLQNRALWFDEALLANNLTGRSFSGLTLPLANNQSAPIGYLWVSKSLTLLLGTEEWVLRLPSLIAGLAAVWLFFLLAKKILDGWWVCLALAFFAFCDPHIYYSSEFKQYALDVFLAILIPLAAFPLLQPSPHRRQLLKLGLLGSIALWFSQPAVFVLAGAGLALLVYHRKNPSLQVAVCGLGLVWVLVFAAYYFTFLSGDIANDRLQTYHQPYFLPLKFWDPAHWEWYYQTWFGLFRFPGGILFKYPAGALGLLGLLLVRRGQRSRHLLLFLPFLLAILASGFQMYSTLSRLMLFAAPALILLVVIGLRITYRHFRNSVYTPWPERLLLFLAILLLMQPVFNSIQRITTPNEINEIKPVLTLVAAEIQAGEPIYLNPGAVPQFEYYQERFRLDEIPLLYGRAAWEDWKKDIDRLKSYPAVWCIFSHDRRNGSTDQEVFAEFFGRYGRISKRKRTIGSGCFLIRFQPE